MKIRSFDGFWFFYLREHSKLSCRLTHYFVAAFAVTIVGMGIFISPWFLLLAAFSDYGPAWFGHFVILKNKPAVFGHPFWSFISDFRILGLARTGQLAPELA